MYRSQQKPNKIHVNYGIAADGGLGDLVGRIVVIKYLYDYHSHIIPHVFIPDFFYDFAERCLPKDRNRLVLCKFSDGEKKFNPKLPTRTIADPSKLTNNLASHHVDHAFWQLINQSVGSEFKNYLEPDVSDVDISRFDLPRDKQYAVITTGFTASVRELLPRHINNIVEYINSQEIEVIFLGKTQVANGTGFTLTPTFEGEVDYSKGINLIDKTSLCEAYKIMAGSKFCLGLDNGLLHVASCSPELPVIWGFTTVLPEHRLPYRKNILGYKAFVARLTNDELSCNGCQSRQIRYNWNWTKCPYGDRKCTELLDAEHYIEQIKRVLDGK